MEAANDLARRLIIEIHLEVAVLCLTTDDALVCGGYSLLGTIKTDELGCEKKSLLLFAASDRRVKLEDEYLVYVSLNGRMGTLEVDLSERVLLTKLS